MQGAAFLYFGSATGPSNTPDWSDYGDVSYSQFGYPVRWAGDVNGDSFDDLAIGALGASAQDVAGRIHVLYGSSFGPDPFTELVIVGAPLIGNYDSQLGLALDGPGDLDGDGYGDLVGGDRDVPSQPGGLSYAWAGGPSGLDPVAVWQTGSAVSVYNWGTAVNFAGDVDADGFSDFTAGDPSFGGVTYYEEGRIHQYAGGSGFTGETGAFPWRPRAFQADGTTPLSSGGLSLGASFVVACHGRAPWGRARVILQVEAKAHAVPFDGQDLFESAAWTDTGVDGVDLDVLVTGLAGGLPHHWRARLAFDPAQAPPTRWTRWFYGVPGAAESIHVRTWPDTDGDGDPDSSDCDVDDPTVYTGAPEDCDGVDEDCDGDVDEDFDLDQDGAFDGDVAACVTAWASADLVDCDDGDPLVRPGGAEACDGEDTDCDGSLVDEFGDLDGDLDPDCTDTDDDGDGYDEGPDDCDDANADVNAAALEACDDLDADCDGSLVDEFADLDGDGVPDCTDTDADGDGFASVDSSGADCDDADGSIHPDADEACDGVDSDCDGVVPADELDNDGDGYLACGDPADCDDDLDTVQPGGAELCDGLDNDCDGAIPGDEVDDDGDGFDECADGDCDDAAVAVFPGATEACDRLDTDCDGTVPDVEVDGDGDGQTPCEGDCDDVNPLVYEGAAETCDAIDSDCDTSLVDEFEDTDGDLDPDCTDEDDDDDTFDDDIDQDCDGDLVEIYTDTDGDGTPDCWDEDDDDDGSLDVLDCAPRDPAVWPGADEACDGLDTDCNGVIPADEVDVDNDGSLACDDCDDDEPTVHPGAERLCDGLDNDCDGLGDESEGFDFIEWYWDDDGDDFGSSVPHPDNPLCASPGEDWSDNDTDCDDASGSIYPGAVELCDDRDTDCDGVADADEEELDGQLVEWYRDSDGDTYGSGLAYEGGPLCGPPGEGWSRNNEDCNDSDRTMNPGANEVPDDGFDNDCVDGDEVTLGGAAPGVACSEAGGGGGGFWLLVCLLAARRRRAIGPSGRGGRLAAVRRRRRSRSHSSAR